MQHFLIVVWFVVSMLEMSFLFLPNIDPCPYVDQLAGFSLHVSNSSKKEEGFNCFHDFSFRPDLLSCDRTINCSVNGRYVIFYNERRKDTSYPRFFSEYAHIDLCDVEVYGNSSFIK